MSKLEKLNNKLPEVSSIVFIIKKVIAPVITGILRRFEYLTANFLWNPKNLITVRIEPDLLTPGIIAIHWKIPIKKDVK